MLCCVSAVARCQCVCPRRRKKNHRNQVYFVWISFNWRVYMGLKRYNVDCGRFAIAFFCSAAVTWVSTHGHRKPSIIQVAINWSHQWSLGDFTRHFFIILNPEIESYTIKKINNFILWTTTVTRKMLAAICLSDFSAPICWCKAVASSYPCVSHTSIYSYYILSRNDSKLLFRNHKIASHLIRAYTNEMNIKKLSTRPLHIVCDAAWIRLTHFWLHAQSEMEET